MKSEERLVPDVLENIAYIMPFWAAFIGGYLSGSVPFGLLFTRMAGTRDIRTIGSGNIGATNVLRTGRKDLAALTLLLDAVKGTVPVLIAARYGPDTMIFAGSGAMLGHVFPVWLRGRGGRGVATALGVLFGMSWQVAILACAIWLAVAALTRYSSLAAVLAIVATPGLAKWLATPQIAEFGVFLSVVILFRHLGNLSRLIRGEEPRIGKTAKDGDEGGP
jgi:glycerol-3-phosphate acyltransferase PlsY